MDRLLAAEGFALFDVDEDAELFWPGAVDWLRERGQRVSVSFPILVDDRLYGQISLAYPETPTFSLGQRELVQALSTQAALAIELKHLAEEAKEAAVARERELAARRRADQLEAANKAMWHGSEMIAAAENETAVLGAMLSQAVEATGASGAAVMRRAVTVGKRVILAALSQDGIALDVATLAGMPCVVELESLSVSDPTGYFKELLDGSLASRHCDEHLVCWAPESAAYHATYGHKIVWDYPFRDGAEVGGWISLSFKDERVLDEAALQVLATLTSHVSLALKMGRLSLVSQEAAVAAERNRLAGEIHDSLAQSFAGISMQLETAEDAAQCGEEDVVLSSMRRAKELARFGLSEAKRSVLALRPTKALAGGLEAAMQSLAERSSIDGLLKCWFTVTGDPKPLNPDCNFNLFRVTQEAVNNAVRHGRPSAVEISLDFGPEDVTLRVADNGKGIDPTRPLDGLGGLAAIRQRVDRLDGRFEIYSSPGQGTVLTISVQMAGRRL
jgi:signal transduction histidine kinase